MLTNGFGYINILVTLETMSLFFSNNNISISQISVKAIIYRYDGKILLQQRDNNKDIPLPNYWNFFGGLVEKKENPKQSLKRELIEEIDCIPGKIKNQLFEWIYGNEWNQSLNIFFPIFFNQKKNN